MYFVITSIITVFAIISFTVAVLSKNFNRNFFLNDKINKLTINHQINTKEYLYQDYIFPCYVFFKNI